MRDTPTPMTLAELARWIRRYRREYPGVGRLPVVVRGDGQVESIALVDPNGERFTRAEIIGGGVEPDGQD